MTIELARLIGSSPDATAKQMIMLRRAGLVEQVYGFTRSRKNICRCPASPSWISAIACSGWMRRRAPSRPVSPCDSRLGLAVREIGEVKFADGCRQLVAPKSDEGGNFAGGRVLALQQASFIIVRLRAIEPLGDFLEPKTALHELKCQHKPWEYALRRNELRFYDLRQKVPSLSCEELHPQNLQV